jgi:uncharacterized membrane protein YeaQ/YmgE (transglycosylase-associated protein family)
MPVLVSGVWSLLWFILLGGLVGWLAGLAFRRRGFGCLGNVAVGVVGAVLGGLLFRLAGIRLGGLLGGLLSAFVGAVLFVVVLSLVVKRR